MSSYSFDFYLLIALLSIEAIVLIGYIAVYFKKMHPSIRVLIWSVTLFICGNIATLSYHIYEYEAFTFFEGMLLTSGLVPIVLFLEIFENGLSFTPRSSGSAMFILIVGAVKGAVELFPENIGGFLEFISPLMFILVGVFYNNTIGKMKQRIRFENQKRKIRLVRTGIYLTFILPKFILGSLLTINVIPAFIFENYPIEILVSDLWQNTMAVLLNLIQVIGLIIMSLPVLLSRSVFFMQSRQVSKLTVINKDGIPVFEFPFELQNGEYDEALVKQAYSALGSIMQNSSRAPRQNLRSINFANMEIITEIRDNFTVLVFADRPTNFLVQSIENFGSEFERIYPEHVELSELRPQKLKILGEKMIQKSFGLQQEEFEQIKMIVQQGFDRIATQYKEARTVRNSDEMKLIPDFIDRLPEGSRVLDAGCGSGMPVTQMLADKFEVIGVDISRKQIELAEEMLPQCDFVWQDMTTLTYPNEYFDGIISYYAITHIPREEHKGLVENFYRMLKEGGLALLCFSTLDDPGKVVDDYFGVKMYWSSFDAGTNVELMKETGFKILWLKLIFDQITDQQHLFVLAEKEKIAP